MRVLTGQGVGDSVWSLFKAAGMMKANGDDRFDVRIACWNLGSLEERALEFLRRFPIVDSATRYTMPRVGEGALLKPGPPADEHGAYRYIDDGPCRDLPGIDFVAIPNSALEKGRRLEEWLPEYDVDWSVGESFKNTDAELELADAFARADAVDGCPGYAVFFMSSLDGNSIAGHNRGALWTADQWVELGERIHRLLGIRLVVVGADWDLDYYQRAIGPRVATLAHWQNVIGKYTLCETLAIIRRARLVVSYQSGLGIMAHYFRRPTVMWWRPYGDSISPNAFVSPREEMATAWAYRDWRASGKYLPCVYGRESVTDIVEFIERKGW